MPLVRSRIAALAGCLLAVGLALPAGAQAASFVVTSNGDTTDTNPGNGTCLATGTGCTLRAAIAESNALAGADSISFDAAFDGTVPGSVIEAGSTLQITAPVAISGGNCGTSTLPRPCADIRVANPIQVFSVSANDLTLQGLAISSGSGTGVDLTGTSQDAAIKGNWFGRRLDGSISPNSTGVRVGTDAGNARIGGQAATDRNIFEGGVAGIEITGDDNLIEGNAFGFEPDLTSGFASIYGIRIGLGVTEPNPTAGNVVGGNDPGPGATPTVCDGPCNMFNSGGTQIVLNDTTVNEVDQTLIRGNFMGFGITGDAAPGASVGIDAQEADDTTIGGPTQASANYIGGTNFAGVVATQGAQALSIESNHLGLAPAGTSAHPNGDADLYLRTSNASTVENNRFASNGSRPRTAAIYALNSVTMTGNGFGKGTGGEDLGYNVPAIKIDGSDNKVGSDTPADFNRIDNGADTAIEIVGSTSDGNEVLTNTGQGNEGLFLDLIPGEGPGNDPSDGANGGIQAPLITAVSPSNISGTREQFSAVRVYRVNQGGIVEVVGADLSVSSSTSWSVNLPGSLAAGDCVAVIQTITFGGSSETSTPVAPISGTCDFDAPETQITGGPAQGSTITGPSPTFTFSTTGDSAQCRFDNEAWRACSAATSDTPAAPLGLGTHTFQVRGKDLAGNPDPTPAGRDFTVAAVVPPAHSTSTDLQCAPASVAIAAATTCVATVSDVDGTPTQPQGQVGFTTSGSGAFGSGASCTLAGASPSSSSCGVSYTPSSVGTGSHQITASYTGTTEHLAGADDAGVTVSATGNPPVDPPDDPPVDPPTGDTTAPATRITSQPKSKLKLKRGKKTVKAKFAFTSDEAGSSFSCSIDKKPMSPCGSPKTLKLKRGKHVFSVTATDRAGNTDRTPAQVKIKVS